MSRVERQLQLYRAPLAILAGAAAASGLLGAMTAAVGVYLAMLGTQSIFPPPEQVGFFAAVFFACAFLVYLVGIVLVGVPAWAALHRLGWRSLRSAICLGALASLTGAMLLAQPIPTKISMGFAAFGFGIAIAGAVGAWVVWAMSYRSPRDAT